MDSIWAPWRRTYVTSGVESPGCVFCNALERVAEPESLVVHVAPLSLILMNLFPYNSGHIMVAPRRHIARLAEADEAELVELMGLTRRLEGVLTEVYRPQGLNLGMNLGRTAGAGVEDHLHMHLVPRWNGDTNFMTVIGETRVIPEDPREACRKLRTYFS